MRDIYIINWSDDSQWQVTKSGFEFFKQLDSMLRSLWKSIMVADKESALYWADKENEDGRIG